MAMEDVVVDALEEVLDEVVEVVEVNLTFIIYISNLISTPNSEYLLQIQQFGVLRLTILFLLAD